MSDIKIFTVVLDFLGGDVHRQVGARNVDQEIRKWAREVDLEPIEGISEPDRLTLQQEVESEPPEALNGVQSAWCTDATGEAARTGIDRRRVAVALTSLLASIGNLAPCVLVIEDIHWADAGSRAVLEHLAENGAPKGITIVATTRSGTAVPSGFETLTLAPLSESEGDALIAVGLGGSEDEVVAELKQRVPLLATGNPLVTIQVLRHLETNRCLIRDGETLRLDEAQLRDYQPPDCVRGVIAASLSGLSEETRSVLAVGALLGRRFRWADLYQLGVFDRAAIKRTFNEALAAQVLSRSQCGDAAIFVHDTVREELSKALSTEETRDLHLGIAKLLESHLASASELAHHYDLGDDCENAARTHLEAGRDARTLHAPIDAAIHFERATANALRTSSAERDQVLFRATFELVGASSQLGNTEDRWDVSLSDDALCRSPTVSRQRARPRQAPANALARQRRSARNQHGSRLELRLPRRRILCQGRSRSCAPLLRERARARRQKRRRRICRTRWPYRPLGQR